MAIVVKAFVLCETDNPVEAQQAVFATLNGGAFESANPIIDFATGIEQAVELAPDYQDGEFLSQVPGAVLLDTANSICLPI